MAKGGKRAGRHRKAGVREPTTGRPQRPSDAQEQREILSVGVEARMRVYGLSRGDAEKQESGDALGRYLLSGKISKEQALAGEEYERVCRSYDAAMDAK